MGSKERARPAGPWRSGWRRLRRDRGGLVSLVAVALIVLVALFGSAVVSRLVGHDGNAPFLYAASTGERAVGPWTHVPVPSNPPFDAYGNLLPAPKGTRTTLFVLGADGPLGRDELIRLLDGLRTSLEVGLGAMLVALVLAVPFGTLAG
jgi:peptide/nickel transport system permease protein